ncbi:MAG: C69 family dipeptidase [Bacteroidales bacterium]|nr:C69 family dipeptidase [Bacteroidales bacterium]
MIRRIIKSVLCISAALMMYQPAEACTNVLVSKGASKDGSVMVTYSADSHQLYGELYFKPAGVFAKGTFLDVTEWDTGKYMGKIAQIARTYQTVGNMNEHQVSIVESTFGGREELPNPDGIMDYGSLIYITLQRAKTAREAIQIIDELMQTYGYASGGESFSVADKNEIWIMEIVGKGSKEKGAVWVAARVPDGYVCAHANQSRIHKINFNDPENWLYAKDVVDFARSMGYYEGSDEDFSFCDAYCPADFGALRGCEARVWAAFNILGKGMFNDKKAEEYLDFAMGHNASNKMPLFIKPAQKVSAKELADVMRDHYEGTPMDMTTDIGAGGHHNPYRWRPMYFEVDGEQYLNERAIATQQTGFWYLCQSRSWLPDEVGGVIWFGVDDAATSCLTPVYTSVKSVPECVAQGNGNMLTYSPTSLFWLTNRVAHMAYLMYDRVAPDIQAVADKFENDCIAEQAEIDAKALQIMESASDKEEASAKVREYLTAYSKQKAQQLFNTWQGLDSYFLVKYMDGNVKRQNEDGSFKDNGHSPAIPASPVQPGYSQKWKEAVVKDAGEILKVK